MNEEFICSILAELFDYPCNSLHPKKNCIVTKRTASGVKNIVVKQPPQIVGCVISN